MKKCIKAIATEQIIERDLKEINTTLNRFLKQHFTIEMDSLQEYLHNVKDLLIELTTRQLTPILSNIFSKISNILQPFTSYSYDLSLDSLKNQCAQMKQQNTKLSRRLEKTKIEMEQYRVKSTRMGDFIYMLRVSNINVDQLFRKGVMKGKVTNIEQQEAEVPMRVGVQLQRQDWMNLQQQSNLTSQYVSTKSRR